MRRTPLKRKVGLVSRIGLRRTKGLRMRGVSDSSVLRERIQAKLREAVIKRDKVCLLSGYPETGKCNQVMQCEHLISRSESSSFADLRNVVLLCSRHHIFWKPQNSLRYWEIIEEMIGPERWDWIQKMRKEQSAHRSVKIDWKLELLALESQIKKMK